MKKIKIKKDTSDSGLTKVSASQRPFGKINFYMMGGCILMILIGFILISGGGSQDESFNPEIFSARRIIVGPLLAFLGFLLMAFAIMWQPKKNRKSNDN